jgi:Ca2+-binding EF-hand superfamily protein
MALRKAFKYFDTDGSGDIDPDEFYAAMHAFGLEFTEDQVMAMFGYYDIDRDCGLSYYEFLDKVLGDGFGGDPEYAVLMAMPEPLTAEADRMRTTMPKELLVESECKKVFDRYDVNNSGEIDLRGLSSLVRSLGLSLDREAINHAMLDLDLNRNGTISWEEFWLWWQTASDRTQSAAAGGSPPQRPATHQGTRTPSRPDSRQSTRNKEDSEAPPRTPNPLAKGSGLKALHEKVNGLGSGSSQRPKSRNGQWLTGDRPMSSYGTSESQNGKLELARPLTRSSMHSTLSRDFQPPMSMRPPRVHGLRRLPRPHTAPTPNDQMYKSYIPVVGAPSGPTGTHTGFRL